MQRWRFSRFVSPIAALMLLFALVACMRGPMVAAPAGPPQPPVTGPGGPPPGGPPPRSGGPVKVAVLLPLSGANAELGKAMLEAAQMALFDEAGVDPARVCIGHCDTFPSLPYCLSVARWGGYVSGSYTHSDAADEL